ncbi:serine/threonine-protein phosphatase 2A regulatory subunit B'' subunit alpha isoform X1 [Osmerus mordax]|uniref:serine/threonine-protein phosphatase 2A regulatory subunit B'' subunit alpha isoform X1 n=1 Tax=Osmerus mordax TaxID=8014 RepID=UPI00350ECAB1
MAAAYRLVVSSVSCYSSVVVDRRSHSHAVHYCSGPCGAQSQGLDCTVAHRSTCSELLTCPDPGRHAHAPTRNPPAASPTHHAKSGVSMETGCNGGVWEDSPPWRGKKAGGVGAGSGGASAVVVGGGPTPSGSLKDITGEAINLASGKLKEFSFEKLRLSSSHVTFRKGRKVRPDSFSRRSTDLDIIYGHFSSNTAPAAPSNDENQPPFGPGKGVGAEECKPKSSGLLSASKVGGGSTGSLSSVCSGSLEAGLNTVASLYLSTLGEENLIARLLEKTRGEHGGAGGEDIRACLDILLKCSEDLKKCTDIIKQCIRRKAPGGGEDGGVSPETMYQAVMSRLSSYLKRLPLELEGGAAGLGAGGQGAGGGHSELAELVSSLHSLQTQGSFSPMFGNEQPPRYEDVVQSPPLQKTALPSTSSSPPPTSSASVSSSTTKVGSGSSHKPNQNPTSRTAPLSNGLQHAPHTHSPSTHTHTPSVSPPGPAHNTPIPSSTPPHAPPVSHMEPLYIEEDSDQARGQGPTPARSPGRHATHSQRGTGAPLNPRVPHMAPAPSAQALLHPPACPPWPAPAVSSREDDIDKLLLDLEKLSQSMSPEKERGKEPPLPAKTRQRWGAQGGAPPQAPPPTQLPEPVSHLAAKGQSSGPLAVAAVAPQGGCTEAGPGEEEDGALLMRILESIESFAQELVESGVGTGSAGKSSGKEKEVMRLLQDTLAPGAKADTPPATPVPWPVEPKLVPLPGPKSEPPRSALPSPIPPAQAVPEPLTGSTPGAVIPTPAPEPLPAAPASASVFATAHTPLPTLGHEPPPTPSAPVPTLATATATAPTTTPTSTPTPAPVHVLQTSAVSILAPASTPAPASAPAAALTSTTFFTPAPVPASTPAIVMASAPAPGHAPALASTLGPAPATSFTPASIPASIPATISAPSSEEAPAHISISAPVAEKDADVGSIAMRDCGSTLLIQQSPEVIRVQCKTEKKPGTPPPAPTPAPSTPVPRSPSPPPAPVVVTPPPPSVNIPRFYYPRGLPGPAPNHDVAIASVEAAFSEFEEEKADIYEMGKIAKACGCPLYWKAPMFNGAGGERTGFVSVHSFIATWRKLLHSCYDDSSKFISLLAKPSCSYLDQEDFIPLLQDIVDTHPGLTFLKDAPEFHSRYITTVIQRIFYTVNRSWTGRITMTELRRSNFLQTLALLEEEDDINQITDYFSYEHFYVIYCKFWELDTDHDLYIDPKDLARYNDHASSNRIIERLFSGAVTRGSSVQREGRMSYAEFVWFLISEEDKKNPTSVEYWFRCMDVDGDGVLSMFELEYFYEEQCDRMEGMGIEPLPFQDLLCQMLDLVKPESQGMITLRDLKRCRMGHIFFDTFFNLEKYLDHEQRDPFAVQKDIESEGPEPSDWDKYASEEYEILVAEETANEQLQDGSFDEDYESDDLPVPGDIGNKMDKLVLSDLSA